MKRIKVSGVLRSVGRDRDNPEGWGDGTSIRWGDWDVVVG